MSETLIAALLRELMTDPDAVRTLQGLVEPADEAPPPTPAYTVTTLSRCMGLSEKAIRNAITRGELPARKRGGRWVITADEVARWLGPPERIQRHHVRRPRRGGPLGSAFGDLGERA